MSELTEDLMQYVAHSKKYAQRKTLKRLKENNPLN